VVFLLSLDIDTAAGEAKAVHAYNQGWFAVLNKYQETAKQKLFKMDMLEDVVRALDRSPDTYISQASFTHKSRRISALSTIGCAFVDLDCYKLGFTPDEYLVRDLMAEAADAGMPLPSYVTYSGRGLYMKWLFDAAVPATQLHRWRALQSVLVPMFRAFGSDVVAKDACRYLRVVGSTNTAGDGRRVAQLWSNGKRYSFDELCNAAASVDMSDWQPVSKSLRKNTSEQGILLPDHAGNYESEKDGEAQVKRLIASRQKRLMLSDTELSEAQVRKAHEVGLANLDAYSRSREPVMLEAFSRRSLAWRRFVDLRDLAMARKGIPRGSRDIHLFWMLNFLAQAGVVNETNFEDEARTLSETFVGSDFRPMSDGSLSTIRSRIFSYTQGTKERSERERVARANGKLVRGHQYPPRRDADGEEIEGSGAKQRPLYNPSTEFLIELFEISTDEQHGLATLISGQEKQRRSDLKVPGRAERREARVTWRALALQLAQTERDIGNEPSVSKIAEKVGVHKSMVSRLLSGKLGAQPGQRSYVRRAPVRSNRFGDSHGQQRPANPFARLVKHGPAQKNFQDAAPRTSAGATPKALRKHASQSEAAPVRFQQWPVANPFAKLAERTRRDEQRKSLGRASSLGRGPTTQAARLPHTLSRTGLTSGGRPLAHEVHALHDAQAPTFSAAAEGSKIKLDLPAQKIAVADPASFVRPPVAEFSVDRKERGEEQDSDSRGSVSGLQSVCSRFEAGGTKLGQVGAQVEADGRSSSHQQALDDIANLAQTSDMVRELTLQEARRRAAEREAELQRLVAEREQRTLRALQRVERIRQGRAGTDEAHVISSSSSPNTSGTSTADQQEQIAAAAAATLVASLMRPSIK